MMSGLQKWSQQFSMLMRCHFQSKHQCISIENCFIAFDMDSEFTRRLAGPFVGGTHSYSKKLPASSEAPFCSVLGSSQLYMLHTTLREDDFNFSIALLR